MVDPTAWVVPFVALAGLLAMNVVLTLVLYRNDRTPLHRALALFWLFSTAQVVVMALWPLPPQAIVAFALPGFGFCLSIADFLRRLLSLQWHRRLYVIAFVAGGLASVIAGIAGAPFWVVSLPCALANALPTLDIALQAFRDRRGLSVTVRLMAGTVLLVGLHQVDYPFFRPDARMIPIAFAIALTMLFALSILGPLIILERAEAEVRRLQAKALERERLTALGEAAAVVAHEVRNPLATMTNTIELLGKEQLTDEGRDLLVIQRDEIQRLDRLVRDLLSFSKPLEPQLADVDMTALVREAVRSLRADAESAHVGLEVEESGSCTVHGDPDSIHMALVNVLQNAIQASPQGGTVRIGLSDGDSEVHVRVDDEGGGVPDETLDRMFEPFFTTRATGSGLGLAILDRIMKAHGGQVRVKNLGEKGARFELVFVSPSRRRP